MQFYKSTEVYAEKLFKKATTTKNITSRST